MLLVAIPVVFVVVSAGPLGEFAKALGGSLAGQAASAPAAGWSAAFIAARLEGSLAVIFIFLLDVFSGPGMASSAGPLSVSRKAADVLRRPAAVVPRPATG